MGDVSTIYARGRVFAQQSAISGTVTDAQTGEPIPYVSIVFQGTTIGTVTDSTGNYSINRPTHADTLNFSAIGYYPVQKIVHHLGSDPLFVELTPKIFDISEIQVTSG
ncbi:MAG: carboxypeptidase-like regulatory domain-containing protein [Mangrovibacterium sp.]